MVGFEFYSSDNERILKVGDDTYNPFRINLRKDDRVVGIQAHKYTYLYYNLQFVIMGP